MFSSLALLSLLWPLQTFGAITSLSSISLDSPAATRKYIVELDNPSNLDSLTSKRSLSPHQELYSYLRKRGISHQAEAEWNHGDLFVGVEIQLETDEDLLAIYSAPGVLSVRPVSFFAPPVPVKQYTPTGIDDPELPPNSMSTHIMTGVNKLHAEGTLGQGIKIGIIDSGVDYTHPNLGGCFGPGCLIAGGYDFVGDEYNGQNTPVPDGDPQDCAGHGTYVTGIIAAQPGNQYNVTGVAYKSTFNAYKTFGCEGNVQDPVLVSAILRAYDDGNDVITMSLGEASSWTESTIAVVASRIARRGRVVTVSIGNDGNQGAWYNTSPCTGTDVICVGSTDNIVLQINNATLSNGAAPIPYLSFMPLEITDTRPIYATSTDITNPTDACEGLPASTPNLSSYVVVIKRGGCPLSVKIEAAVAKGANAFLIYDDGTGFAPVNFGPYTPRAALIRNEDGITLVNYFANRNNAKIKFPRDRPFTYKDAAGGLVSSFSNWGLTYDMYQKPSVTAPGGNIVSTVPMAYGGFRMISGTSGSAPFVAGAAALLLQKKGKSIGTNIRTLLESTAFPLSVSHADNAPLESVAHQGAGQINVWNAARYTTKVSPGEFHLNDTQSFLSSIQYLTIENTSGSSVTYTFTHSPAITVVSIDPSTGLPNMAIPNQSPMPTSQKTASVTFVPSILSLIGIGKKNKVTVAQRSSTKIGFYFKAPNGLDSASFPIYSGYIVLTGSNGEVLSIPYSGVASNLKDMKILDTTPMMFGVNLPILLDPSFFPQTEPRNWTLEANGYPIILYRNAAGTPLLRIDLVDKSTTVPNVVAPAKRGLVDWILGFFGGGGSGNNNGGSNTFDKIPIVGPLLTTPYVPRNILVPDLGPGYFIHQFTGSFANGTQVPDGEYKFLIRALKITGNARKQEEYESWLSPIVGIRRPSQIPPPSSLRRHLKRRSLYAS